MISAMGANTEVQIADQRVGAGGQFYNPLNPRSGSNRYSRQARGPTIFPFLPCPPFFPPDLFLYKNLGAYLIPHLYFLGLLFF